MRYVIGFIAAALLFAFGLYSGYTQNVLLRTALDIRRVFVPPLPETGKHDEFGRQIRTPHAAVPCPKDARVMIVAGQSNAGNWVGRRHVGSAFQFFRGKCYPAADPLLGADGRAGSLWVALANEMKETVVLVPMSVGATTIDHWNTKLVPVVTETLEALKSSGYTATDFLWQHGESNSERTSTEAYRAGLGSLVGRVKEAFPKIRIYVARSTVCDGRGPDEKVRAAQSEYPGPDTDAISGIEDRSDGCHFSETGQRKAVESWRRVIHRAPMFPPP
jgi:hypothetical protein